jgi:hypothetical protein
MAVDSGNGPTGTRSLPGSVVRDILSSDRRRVLLRALADADGPVIVEELATTIVERERGTPPGSVDPERRAAVVDDIYDRHLPKLLATGIVEYDSMMGAVSLVDESVLTEL